MEKKKCSKCQTEKDISCFAKNQYKCKECVSLYFQEKQEKAKALSLMTEAEKLKNVRADAFHYLHKVIKRNQLDSTGVNAAKVIIHYTTPKDNVITDNPIYPEDHSLGSKEELRKLLNELPSGFLDDLIKKNGE